DMLANLHFTKEIGLQSRDALAAGDLRKFADLMAVHWEHKKKRSSGMSSPRIDELYDLALANGALGGKLVGAGGGGFLLFYTEEKTRLRHTMRSAGLREVRLQFDFAGVGSGADGAFVLVCRAGQSCFARCAVHDPRGAVRGEPGSSRGDPGGG